MDTQTIRKNVAILGIFALLLLAFIGLSDYRKNTTVLNNINTGTDGNTGGVLNSLDEQSMALILKTLAEKNNE